MFNLACDHQGATFLNRHKHVGWIAAAVLRCVIHLSAGSAGAVGSSLGVVQKPFFREGQTFLTWQEDASVTGEWYCIYAAAEPITAGNLDKAKRLAKIPEGSRRFPFLRNVKKDTAKGFFQNLAKEKWFHAIQIEDDENGAKQLPEGTGLFVRTIHAPAKTYYAMTVERDGKEDRSSVAATATPVEESVGTPGAVLQQKLGDRHYLYAFFCDYEVWNPDGIEDNWEGYAHVFQIRAPKAGAKTTAEPYPVAFRQHAYAAWKDWDIAYCWPDTHVNVRLLDYHLTWWFGYNDNLPRLSPDGKSSLPGLVVNFTERRVMQVARWLASGPKNFPFRVDPDRLCILGGSMGGTGTHLIGARNGDVFAAAFADEGIWNWALEPRWNRWTPDVVPKFGPRDRVDPTPDNVPVYEALNQTKQAAEHPERELPFFDIGQGIIDYVIPFHDVTEYWKALEKGKHAYAACWEMADHRPWAGPASAMDYRQIQKDEVLPAFANASCNTPLHSGFRICHVYEGLTAKTLTINPGSLNADINKRGQNDHVDGAFPPNLKGKTLVLAPSAATRTFFRIAGNTPTELTIEEGDLLAYSPPSPKGSQKPGGKSKKSEAGAAEDEAVPAEKKPRMFLVCDGAPRGTWNGHFQWSTKNQNFDPKSTEDDIVDEAGRLAICLRVTKNRFSDWDGESATADVTPRRCRNFKPAAGEKVRWENWDMRDPAMPVKRAEGEVTVDAHGLVTVPGFVVGRHGWGSRLVLIKRPQTDANRGEL
jgi:hypothetical protein